MTPADHRYGKLARAIVLWLCGIWAFALGVRLTYSLCIYRWITIPSHPINIFFDFLLLSIFGGIVLFFALQDLSTFLSSNNEKMKISVKRITLKFNSGAKNWKE
jgi:TRAP-type C4-dicarboxylate transport system permease small subunit